MEHLFAYSPITIFKGHRGDKFTKVIQITTNKQLSFVVKVAEDSEMELTVRDRRTEVEFDMWRTVTILWINMAHDPSAPIRATLDPRPYVQEVVRDQLPEVLLITSTGSAFSPGHIRPTMKAIKHTAAYKEDIGLEHGVCCVSCGPHDVMWQDKNRGNSVRSGVVIHYNWHV